jgi:hypothetical protein
VVERLIAVEVGRVDQRSLSRKVDIVDDDEQPVHLAARRAFVRVDGLLLHAEPVGREVAALGGDGDGAGRVRALEAGGGDVTGEQAVEDRALAGARPAEDRNDRRAVAGVAQVESQRCGVGAEPVNSSADAATAAARAAQRRELLVQRVQRRVEARCPQRHPSVSVYHKAADASNMRYA